MKYAERDELFSMSDVVILPAPLTSETRHMINADGLRLFLKGSILINTGRGGLIDTSAAIAVLRRLEGVHDHGLDVYENQAGLFFEDRSLDVVIDDALQFLSTMKDVVITPHSA